MRIGIVTMWNATDNYGGILQTYALQRYLRNLGHDAYDIRFIKTNSRFYKVKLFLKKLMILLHLPLRNVEFAEKMAKRRNFDGFRKENIALSKSVYYSLRKIRKNPPVADMYITGSDQVWARSLNNSPNERVWYLDFGPVQVKRIAYAVSFGHDYFPAENELLFEQLLKGFDKISAREINGVQFCIERGFKAQRCVDSTLLLNSDSYLSLLADRKYREKYAYSYFVNVVEPYEVHWEEILTDIRQEELTPICTTASGYQPASEIFVGAVYDYATVNEWLSNIFYAEIIFSSSFHGIIFSILFKKNFLYLPLTTNGSGNDRIDDLLLTLGLQNRKVAVREDIRKLMNEAINYEEIDTAKLDSLIESSKHFLEESLKA